MPQEPVDPEILRNLISGQEPDDLPPYLTIPQEGRLLHEGTSAPILGATRITPVSGSPLVVPEGSATGPEPVDLTLSYLTVGEYLDPVHEGLEIDLVALAKMVADQHERIEMVAQVAGLLHILGKPDITRRVEEQYASMWSPDVAARIRERLGRSTGQRFAFLARQPVLATLRFLLTTEPGPPPERPYPSWFAGILLVHVLSQTLDAGADATTEELLGHPAHLVMEVIRVAPYSEEVDFYAAVDRVVRLWRQMGPRTEWTTLGSEPADLLRGCIGLELEELLGLAFVMLARRIRGLNGDPIFDDPSLRVNVAAEKLDAFLRLVAHSPMDLGEELSRTDRRFGFLPIEQHPVLTTERGLLLLDEYALWNRVTSGLYWIVHDCMRDQTAGEQLNLRWNEIHAQMVELLVESSLRTMAPVLLGEGSTFFTEEDLGDAYPGRKRADALIDFGDSILLCEVVAGRLTVATRVGGEVEAFKKDADRLIIDKCRQLDDCARAILADQSALTGSPSNHHLRITPLVVVGGGFPVNPFTMRYVREELAAEGLLQHARIDDLSILNLEELEMLEGLCEKGESARSVLDRWRSSSLADMPFRSFVITTFGPWGPDSRPARMKEGVDETFRGIIGTLGLSPGDDDASPVSGGSQA